MKSILSISALIFLLSCQTVTSASLLSNFNSTVDGDYSGTPDAANPISTGTSPLVIGSISVNWQLPGPAPGINAVGIYEDDAGFPSNVLVGSLFTNPNPTEAGKMRYKGNAELSANTIYWVVIDINDDSEPAYTFTNIVTADISTGGADIPDGSAYGDDSIGEWFDDPASLIIELDDLIFANGFD